MEKTYFFDSCKETAGGSKAEGLRYMLTFDGNSPQFGIDRGISAGVAILAQQGFCRSGHLERDRPSSDSHL